MSSLQKKKQQDALIFANYIVRILYKYIKSVKIDLYKNNFNFYLNDSQDIVKVLTFFKKHTNCQYVCLSDILGIDLINNKLRFQVVYSLLSLRFNSRIRINLFVDEKTAVPSVTSLYRSAGWLEREVWDMYGVFFNDNSDLRRILTDYGFEGFPLRKDFPLSGFLEIRYDDSLKRIVYEPIEITQEFRFFDFKSPWEQIENIY